MVDRDFIRFLYELVLRRDPDTAGLEQWTRAFEASPDPMTFFKLFWESPEAAATPNPYLKSSRIRRAPALYFFHIPKTAGTSVGRYFDRVCSPAEICPYWSWDDLVATPREQLESFQVFRGHFQGYLEDYLRRPLTMLTILRDPVERSISCYYYARSNPNYPFHQQAMTRTLREYCLDPGTRWRIEDYQTACLLTLLWRCGSNFEADCAAMAGSQFAIHTAVEATTAAGVPVGKRFELACHALERFAAVGITEHLAESLNLFSRTLGLPEVTEPIRENSSANRPAAAEIDGKTLETIRELTRADQLIYDYAKSSFFEKTGLGKRH